MRMLLTANGIKNASIKAELELLLSSSIQDSKIVYIPTATMIEDGDHTWCVNDLNRLYNLGWNEFNILELNGIPRANIARRMKNADAVFLEGGNVYHLVHSIVTNGLTDIFKEIIESKVYIGSSAGSMIFSQAFNEQSAELFEEIPQLLQLEKSSITSPFNLFEWYLKPHVNSPDFPERTDKWMEAIASKADFPIYALDDETALSIGDSTVNVISEGIWKYYAKVTKTERQI